MLGVSIVLYRSPIEGVLATLRGLAAQTVAVVEVVVHANAASGSEIDSLRATLLGGVPGLTRLAVTGSESNLGFCTAHNLALARLFGAGCDAVVVLNPDLVLDQDALAELTSAETDLPQPALLGPLLELADPVDLRPTGRIDTTGIRWAPGARHLDARQGDPMVDLPTASVRVDGISGACLYVSRTAYDRITGASGEFFDEDFVAYREDAELAYRAGLLGIPSYLVPAARGVHARRLRGTTRGGDPAIDLLGVRNRFLIAFKYGVRRPGGLASGLARDVVVVAAVVTRERSSLPGLWQAWRLRHRMRAKGRQVRAFDASRK